VLTHDGQGQGTQLRGFSDWGQLQGKTFAQASRAHASRLQGLHPRQRQGQFMRLRRWPQPGQRWAQFAQGHAQVAVIVQAIHEGQRQQALALWQPQEAQLASQMFRQGQQARQAVLERIAATSAAQVSERHCQAAPAVPCPACSARSADGSTLSSGGVRAATTAPA
jgi:hypothetical protein